jgi:hypothetical protein
MVDFDHSKFHILIIDVLAIGLYNFKSVQQIINELQHNQGRFFWCMSYPLSQQDLQIRSSHDGQPIREVLIPFNFSALVPGLSL